MYPVRLGPSAKLVRRDASRRALHRRVRGGRNYRLPMLRCDSRGLTRRVVSVGTRAIVITSRLHHCSSGCSVFSIHVRSFNLRVTVLTSTTSASGRRVRIQSVRNAAVVARHLTRCAPTHHLAGHLFSLIVSSLTVVYSLVVAVPITVTVGIASNKPIFCGRAHVNLHNGPFRVCGFHSVIIGTSTLGRRLTGRANRASHFVFGVGGSPHVAGIKRFVHHFSVSRLPRFLGM